MSVVTRKDKLGKKTRENKGTSTKDVLTCA